MIDKKFTPEKVEWWVYPLFLLLLTVVRRVLSVRRWFIAFLIMDFVTIIFLLLIRVRDKKCGLGTISFVTHQSIASAFLYLRFFLSCWRIFYLELVNLFTIVGLFWKIGLPPFHGWYSSIFIEVTWFNAFLLSSFLKVPPSILARVVISYRDWKSLWWMISVFAILYRRLILVGQIRARGFFAYSSIGRTCWIILGAAISKEIFFFYFFTYSVIVIIIIMICKKWDIKNISGFINISKKDGWVFACRSFSVAGIPPFAGFMPKLLICFSAILRGRAVLLLVVIGYIIASVISVAGYIDIRNSSICARIFRFTCPIPKEKNKIYLRSLISFIFFFFHLVVGVVTIGVNIRHFYL